MTLNSERLIYKKITQEHFNDYMSWYTNDDVMKLITGKGFSPVEAEAKFKATLTINEKHAVLGFYAVYLKSDNTFAGIAKLTPLKENQVEVGYGLMPQHWGKKLAPEMLQCLITESRKISSITELYGIVNPKNMASKKILTDASFVYHSTVTENNLPLEYFQLIL